MKKIEIVNDKYLMFGSYPQNGTEKEPIKWIIIKKEDNIVTLMSDKYLLILCMIDIIVNIKVVQ